MQLNEDFLSRWENIVNEVDKNHFPIECIKKVVFRTQGRKQHTINLARLRNQGITEDSIQEAVENFIKENEPAISNMEFIIDVEAVAGLVQPETDRLLKNIE